MSQRETRRTATTPVRLTAKERRALEHVARHGAVDWSLFHANTIDALQRKKLIERDPGHFKLTEKGQEEVAVPDMFDDLFPRKADPGRAEAAAEVLRAVWLSERHFELETQVGDPPTVEEDSEGHLWVPVKIHVPALDVDAWLDGTHLDHPDNQGDDRDDGGEGDAAS